jgi:hypothetical protein
MAKSKVPPVKPGEKVKNSGIYESSKSRVRTTLDKGEKAPPTPGSGEKWKPKVITNPKKK